MKEEREILSGIDALLKKRQGGGAIMAPPPPPGKLGLKVSVFLCLSMSLCRILIIAKKSLDI